MQQELFRRLSHAQAQRGAASDKGESESRAHAIIGGRIAFCSLDFSKTYVHDWAPGLRSLLL